MDGVSPLNFRARRFFNSLPFCFGRSPSKAEARPPFPTGPWFDYTASYASFPERAPQLHDVPELRYLGSLVRDHHHLPGADSRILGDPGWRGLRHRGAGLNDLALLRGPHRRPILRHVARAGEPAFHRRNFPLPGDSGHHVRPGLRADVPVLPLLFPTIALTNTLALRQIKDASSGFPIIRMFGTIGWIAIGWTVAYMRIENSSTQFLLAAGASIAMGLFSLTLPHTPPAGKGQPITVRSLLGIDALVMMKDRSYLVFVIASVLACIPLTFYFSFTNDYLNDLHVSNAAGKMTLGQFSEVGVMLLMPFIFRRITVKEIGRAHV